MRARLGSVLAILALGLAIAAAPAAAEDSPGEPVGGSLLGTRGVVVKPLPGAPALPRGLSAASWLVADADTGEVLAARAPHVRRLPASTLKVLTAVTLLPRLAPDELVRTSYDD